MSGIQLRVETHAQTGFTSQLAGVYSFTVENHGTVAAEIAFDKASPTYVPLPAGTSRSFDCIGNTAYQGDIVGRFVGPADVGVRRVSIVKSVLICQK